MNHRERVLSSIRHQVPDRIPLGELVIPDGLVERAVGKKPWNERSRLSMKKQFLEELGMDLVVVDASGRRTGDAEVTESAVAREVEFWARESDFFVFRKGENQLRCRNVFGVDGYKNVVWIFSFLNIIYNNSI